MLSPLTVPAAHIEGPAQSGSCEALCKYLPAAVIHTNSDTWDFDIFLEGGNRRADFSAEEGLEGIRINSNSGT